MVYQQLRRWMEDELGMRFGPADGNESAAAPEKSHAPSKDPAASQEEPPA